MRISVCVCVYVSVSEKSENYDKVMSRNARANIRFIHLFDKTICINMEYLFIHLSFACTIFRCRFSSLGACVFRYAASLPLSLHQQTRNDTCGCQ